MQERVRGLYSRSSPGEKREREKSKRLSLANAWRHNTTCRARYSTQTQRERERERKRESANVASTRRWPSSSSDYTRSTYTLRRYSLLRSQIREPVCVRTARAAPAHLARPPVVYFTACTYIYRHHRSRKNIARERRSMGFKGLFCALAVLCLGAATGKITGKPRNALLLLGECSIVIVFCSRLMMRRVLVYKASRGRLI